ncbi:MAG TPA: S9 family peptidase [Reyranella sp.]|nr:S9 family peptidase [Reyranella sp.]
MKRIRRREFILSGSALALAHPARAQLALPDLIPRRLLFSAPDRTRVNISPDGKLIAFLRPVDGVQNVWVAPLADPGSERALTKISDRDVNSQIVWPYDNRHVVYFREQGGDENWQAHAVDVTNGEIKPLTPGPGVTSYVQQTSVHFPGELLVGHNARDKRFFDVHRVNVATGESKLVYRNDRFAALFTDPHFNVAFGFLYRPDGGYDLIKPDGTLFRRIEADDAYTTGPIEFSDDGRTLYWLDSTNRDRSALVAQDLASGKFHVMSEDIYADYGEPVLDPVTRVPIAAPAVYGHRRWEVLDPAALPDLDIIKTSIQGELGGFNLCNDRSHWVVYGEPTAKPGRFLHYDRAAGKVNLLFSSRPALEKRTLMPMEPVVIPARDGLKLVCYLTRPPHVGRDRATPLVLLVHGGPWFRDYPDFNTTHQWLANRGYSVLSVNYRGSLGFGKDFVNAGNHEWAGRMHNDLIDAVEWATTEMIAVPSQVAIYGASYGGYSALVGVTFTPDRFACAIDLFGISNLVSFAKAIPPYWKPWEPVLKTRMGDVSTEEGRKFLESRSPLTFVDRIQTPLLIGQGGNDVRVTADESDQIVAAMQKRHIPVTYVFYKDEGHGFRRVENRLSFTAVAEAFLAKHLGGSVESVGDDFKGSSIEFRAGRDLIPGIG